VNVHLRILAHVRNRSKRDTKVTRGTPEIWHALASTISLFPPCPFILPSTTIASSLRHNNKLAPFVGAPGMAARKNGRGRAVRTGRAEVVGIFVGADLRIERLDCGRHCGWSGLEWSGAVEWVSLRSLVQRWAPRVSGPMLEPPRRIGKMVTCVRNRPGYRRICAWTTSDMLRLGVGLYRTAIAIECTRSW
jgi:hypothetical protein